ncbi:GIY-YIG nuclease family protein [Pseudomonas sp.]|uniref:GIY-YIG nuclease family protein n=1 Tax=Pseudomonas sp. TaxID=306 RepID=UPI0031D8C6D2
MFGKHFLYILFREDGVCHKMGITSDIHRRINDLNKVHGPFCLKRSLVLRTDSKNEAYMLETALKCSYSSYNTPLLGEHYSDGGTEWFAIDCFSDMCNSLTSFAKDRMGDGYNIEQLNPNIIKPLTKNNIAKQLEFKKSLESRKAQIETLCQNTKNVRNFRTAIKLLMPSLIGVAKVGSNEFNNSYEIFLSADTSPEILDEIFSASRLSADNDEVWAGANLCTYTQCSSKYKKASFSIPHEDDHFESSWESKGKLLTYVSMLEDLAVAFPVPPAYQQHVGRTLWDEMSLEERSLYSRAIWETLFYHSPEDHYESDNETPSIRKNEKLRTTKKRRDKSPAENALTQLSFDFSS